MYDGVSGPSRPRGGDELVFISDQSAESVLFWKKGLQTGSLPVGYRSSACGGAQAAIVYMVPLRRLRGGIVSLCTMAMSNSKSSSDRLYSVATRIVHMNHAGASPVTDAVLERVYEHLRLEQAVGGYRAAAMVQEELASVYNGVADLIHADGSAKEIALVESATVAFTRIFYAALQRRQDEKIVSAAGTTIGTQQDPRSRRRKNIILVSEAEYAANVVSACQWARQHEGWHVLFIPSERRLPRDNAAGVSGSSGKVDLRILQAMLEGRYDYRNPENGEAVRLDPSHIAMVCITHVPTNSGIVNPVERIGQLIADCNNNSSPQSDNIPRIFYLVDACQSVGQMDVNVKRMQCHAMVATGRKYLRAPRGTGFLYVSEQVVGALSPHHCDHYSTPIQHVPTTATTLVDPPLHSSSSSIKEESSLQQPIENMLAFAPRDGAKRFEFWESNIANKLGMGIAVQEAIAMGLDVIAQATQQNALNLYEGLSKLSVVDLTANRGRTLHLHHRPESGIVTFWVDGVESAVLKELLWSDPVKFEVSVVPATSTPIDSSTTKVPDLLRASVSYTTTSEEIDLLCARLSEILRKL